MSFETIQIFYQWPVINDHVQVPPNKETDKTRVTVDEALAAIVGSEEISLTGGSGHNTASKFGAQRFIRLPAITPSTWFAADPVELVADS